MTASLRQLIALLVNPLFLCIVLLVLSSWFLWRRTNAAFVRIAIPVVLLSLFLMSTDPLTEYLGNKLEYQYPVVTQVDPTIKWVIVLSGGQSAAKGIPVNALLNSPSIIRLVEGVRLFRSLPDSKLVLSGGSPCKKEQPEAEKLGELANWFAIPAQRIVLDTKSKNTADQAKEIQTLVHDEPFYLVTSAMHMPRAMALCKQLGLHPIAAPTDFTFGYGTIGSLWRGTSLIPDSSNMGYFSSEMHELLGRLWSLITAK